MGTPYGRFTDSDLTLRDKLAVDRTLLANERTFLGYTRTALAFAVTGGALIHFFEPLAIEILGWVFVGVAVAVMLVGVWRYVKMNRKLGR